MRAVPGNGGPPGARGDRGSTSWLRAAPALRTYLPPRVREHDVPLVPGVPLRHLVPSVGIPLTEVGALVVDDAEVDVDHRPQPGAVVRVEPVPRPQPVAVFAFLLDVHLGSLALRMRVLGIDVEYRNDADDDELAEHAVAEGRVLLTQDRGLLRRRSLSPDAGGGDTDPAPGTPWRDRPARAADVRGRAPDDQLADVLDRFDPPLAPFSLCASCGGRLVPATREEVAELIEPGTARTYTEFVRCERCGQPYWRGAHAGRLEAFVRRVMSE